MDNIREWINTGVNIVGVGAAVVGAYVALMIYQVTVVKIEPAVDDLRRSLSAEIEFPESGDLVGHVTAVHGSVPRGAIAGYLIVEDLMTGDLDVQSEISLDLSGGWSAVARIGNEFSSCDRNYALRVLWTHENVQLRVNPDMPDDARLSIPVLVVRGC